MRLNRLVCRVEHILVWVALPDSARPDVQRNRQLIERNARRFLFQKPGFDCHKPVRPFGRVALQRVDVKRRNEVGNLFLDGAGDVRFHTHKFILLRLRVNSFLHNPFHPVCGFLHGDRRRLRADFIDVSYHIFNDHLIGAILFRHRDSRVRNPLIALAFDRL